MATPSAQLDRVTAEVIEDMKAENEREFKNKIRAQINAIAGTQAKISELNALLVIQKKALRSIELVQVDLSILT